MTPETTLAVAEELVRLRALKRRLEDRLRAFELEQDAAGDAGGYARRYARMLVVSELRLILEV